MTDAMPPDPEAFQHRLVRYFHDCLAAQTDWARAINVIDQKDVMLVPLAASEQARFGASGSLVLSDPEAIELAQRASLGGAHTALFLGALFLVGRIRATDDQTEKRICAPLLEVPLTIRKQSEAEIAIYPDENEFTVNYGLVGELLRGDHDDLQDRLADLAELVPDFPIDAGEFDTFWNGFRMIAPEVHVSHQLPQRSRKADHSTRIADLGLATERSSAGLDDRSGKLGFVDFYIPKIPKDDVFQLLPATAIVLGRKAGREMSALSELRAMEELPLSRTAFGCVFDPATNREGSWQPADPVDVEQAQPLPLTPTQQSIVESSRSAPLTVVTGPPGTGKSYTITAIVLDALLRDQKVLVASQMDKAVEVVADHVESVAGPLAMARSGGRAAQRKLAKKVTRLTGPSSRLEEAAASTIAESEQQHHDLTRQLHQLENSFQTVIEAERRWSQVLEESRRSEPLLPFQVDDVDDRRAGKAERLLTRVRTNLGHGAGTLRRLWGRWDLARIRRLLRVPAGTDPSMEELTALLRFHLLQVERHDIERSLRSPFPANLIWRELADVQRQRHQKAIELLRLIRSRRLRSLVSNQRHRSALRDLATLLRRRKREVKRQLKQSLSAELLLDAFPAWACTSRSLCEILPAEPELFDLVVIDEASQCDLALASVALMRAKRAVVVGDPNQLRHVCFLSRAREQASFVRNQWTPAMQQRFHYRRSLFDVAADTVDQRHFFFLDEHFRSHPQIIDFSNRKFYDASLQIMTSRPSRIPQTAIRVHQVGGKRELDSSINPKEISAVMDVAGSIIGATEKTGDISIGVVSPFRDHADAIRERFVDECSPETIAKYSIVVGTAHSFQGDEKDVMIFSTSIDAESHPASLRFLESPHLFNVAVTRARRELFVVTSLSREELPPGLLREFLAHSESGWSSEQSPEDSSCPIETAIADELKTRPVDTWTGFRSAGTRINVVAMAGSDSVAVMCDRCGKDDETHSRALPSQRRLVRAGWSVCRVPHRTLHSDCSLCLDEILKDITN